MTRVHIMTRVHVRPVFFIVFVFFQRFSFGSACADASLTKKRRGAR